MSTAPVIDVRYRLRPEDIGRSGVYVTIQNVSWQGLEQLAPLLHLREFPTKRLLLDPQQQQALIQITGSTETRAWIGQVILLQVVAVPETNTATNIAASTAANTAKTMNLQADPWRIQLYAPNQRPITLARPRLPWQLSDQTRKTLVLLLLLLLLFFAVTMLDSSESAWQWLLGS